MPIPVITARKQSTLFRVCNDALHDIWDVLDRLENQEWATVDGEAPQDILDVISELKPMVEKAINVKVDENGRII